MDQRQKFQLFSKMACVGSLLGSLGHSSYNDSSTDISDIMSTLDKLLEQREYEWQSCFQLLFLSWMMSQINELNEDMRDHDAVETINSNLSDIVPQIYFYSISSDTTILFRALISNGTTNDDMLLDVPCVKPLILMSASTMQMRSTLYAMGTKIQIVEDVFERDSEFVLF